jgi:hypothetical protein
MQMQLGPQMQTSTPIHSTVAQSNAPHTLVNGQGQGHMNTQTTTTNQDMVFNLQTILNDIQSRLTKLNLLDSINDRLRSIEQRFEMVENDVSQLKRSVTEHEKYLETLHGWDQYSPSFANFLRVLLINFEWFMY